MWSTASAAGGSAPGPAAPSNPILYMSVLVSASCSSTVSAGLMLLGGNSTMPWSSASSLCGGGVCGGCGVGRNDAGGLWGACCCVGWSVISLLGVSPLAGLGLGRLLCTGGFAAALPAAKPVAPATAFRALPNKPFLPDLLLGCGD